ncbi:bifunctional Enoyl-CoA hydratase-isomerase domain/ClpP-crotonase-like domain superfamily [Babesia duncani]|uniref:Bifunctional Enoyl-CoA hydratase-isomerase domain/ClpP-crotonase-like domain superfamily n=1 Tax=Babesia duncani TaxID=323732 RepID=A0AAD9PI39_9APIC|nr:bifunctional Enoyl-CoA hydratase-isomerase domain/ClpP-crotonase-like domain superfamily [Babesia duncani]
MATADAKFMSFTESAIYKKPFASNYNEWIQADYLEAPVDIHNNKKSESPLLSRNNTGMGFLILNGEYTSISQVNALYRKLADLETNVYKRFTVATSMSRDIFTMGLNPLELLMFKESLQKLPTIPDCDIPFQTIKRALDDYLRNIADLSHLVLTYKKPLVFYANGTTAGFGVCLVYMANNGACHRHSRFKCNNITLNVPLYGGLSFVLAMLRGSLGEYLALTGIELCGSDLVWSGLVKRFISPDAIDIMQITSDEHFLQVDDSYSLRNYETLIHKHFKHDTVADIMKSLKNGVGKQAFGQFRGLTDVQIRDWEKRTLSMLKNTIQSQEILNLIRKVKNIKVEILKEAKITPKQWHNMRQSNDSQLLNYDAAGEAELYKAVLEELFIESINLEIKGVYKYQSDNHNPTSENYWKGSIFFKSPWEPVPRSGFALSNIPKLRKLHPDYDEQTGSDHDRIHMQRQVQRWSNDFLQAEFMLMKRILT